MALRCSPQGRIYEEGIRWPTTQGSGAMTPRYIIAEGNRGWHVIRILDSGQRVRVAGPFPSRRQAEEKLESRRKLHDG